MNSVNSIRRINLFGGPGSGKSVLASVVFSKLKMQGFNVELINEYIKFWTYIPRIPKGYDSFYCQAKQINKEDTILRGGTDLIVTDSPILLAYFYACYYQSPAQQAMLDMHREFDSDYRSINIFLERDDKFYSTIGRYENLEQSKDIDKKLEQVIKAYAYSYKRFSCLEHEAIMEYILSEISRGDSVL